MTIIQASRPTAIDGRYELQRRREHFARVQGILTNKGGGFALALNNAELGSPRKLQRATKRIANLGQAVGRPTGITGASALELHERTLDALESWWKSDYSTLRSTIFNLQEPRNRQVFEYVRTVNWLGWRLFLIVENSAPVDVEYGVSPR